MQLENSKVLWSVQPATLMDDVGTVDTMSNPCTNHCSGVQEDSEERMKNISSALSLNRVE